MRGIITVGDPTTGGGVVISGAPRSDIDGRAIARRGDQATCKVRGHPAIVTIVESHAYMTFDDIAVVLHGAALSCGCRVLSAHNPNTSGWVDEGNGVASVAAGSSSTSVHAFDEQVTLEPVGRTGLPAGTAYRVETQDGRVFSGEIGEDGSLPRVHTPTDSEYAVFWADEALARAQ